MLGDFLSLRPPTLSPANVNDSPPACTSLTASHSDRESVVEDVVQDPFKEAAEKESGCKEHSRPLFLLHRVSSTALVRAFFDMEVLEKNDFQ